jgi:hypothetical protein
MINNILFFIVNFVNAPINKNKSKFIKWELIESGIVGVLEVFTTYLN